MADDSELEKRAVEELLRETDRARVRAETMGPTGWMKCPLQSTNKRFLLNTLRSTGVPQRRGSGEPAEGEPSTRGRQRSRSRTPPTRDQRANGGHAEREHHHGDKDRNKGHDRDRDRRYRYRDTSRNRRHRDDSHDRDRDKHRYHKDLCPSEGQSSSRDHP